jgi:hypothetical protein
VAAFVILDFCSKSGINPRAVQALVDIRAALVGIGVEKISGSEAYIW